MNASKVCKINERFYWMRFSEQAYQPKKKKKTHVHVYNQT